jgi:hypothetical protein
MLPELCTSFGFRRELTGEIVVFGGTRMVPEK